MIVKNPTNDSLTVVIKGITLSVGPNSSVEVADNFARAWAKIHGFLLLETSASEVVAEEAVEKVTEPEVEEAPIAAPVEEKVTEPEVVAEAPAKPVRKSNKK